MKPEPTRQMIGTVTGKKGLFFVVECPDAPAHLRILNLVRGQMSGAVVGDRVTLELASCVMWNVIAVEKVQP
mgnify:CR=1 FL=1